MFGAFNHIIIIIPLVTTITLGIFSRNIGNKGAFLITYINLIINIIISWYSFRKFIKQENEIQETLITLGNFLDSSTLKIEWTFDFNNIAIIMLFVVNTISIIVHIYSYIYMFDDPHQIRFLGYLSLFTFFMLILITGDNFFQLFLGWEGVGLCSYLLISFWYTRCNAVSSAFKAIVINRIGDFSLLIGVAVLFWIIQTIKFTFVISIIPFIIDNEIIIFKNNDNNIITLISIFLIIAAMGKSAQIGLHTWLPDAMEGPTPVSALIHAATMVTAGVFLIIKTSIIYEYSNSILIMLMFIGSLTAVISATIGLFLYDIKKIIAYSTCSQLGYMILTCGLSEYMLSLFHLMNHAFFKALLFLCAGSIIHGLSNEQDLRRMGNLRTRGNITYSFLKIGSLALIGYPFLAGFFSKELIIETTFAFYKINNVFIYWMSTITACFTAFYSFRLSNNVFYIKKTKSFKQFYNKFHDIGFTTWGPLLILVLGSITLGFLTKDTFSGLGVTQLINNKSTIPAKNNVIENETLPVYIRVMPTLFSLISFFILDIMKNIFDKTKIIYTKSIYTIFNFLQNKWFFDSVYNKIIVLQVFQKSNKWFIKSIDQGIFELCGPLFITKIIKKTYTILNEKARIDVISKYVASYLYLITVCFILL